MGLAASQARLLTITGRKSDCEFQSMRYSHQKIAMARDLTDVSNEYQNSLNQTKLIYDYYGKNDKSTQLSYGILMQPSALNDYLPIMITDATNRAILDPNLAAAVRAAGIPQEGLGCLPSQEMRNKFVAGLYGAGVITYETAQMIADCEYNQKAGLGSTSPLIVNTEKISYDKLLDKLKTKKFDFSSEISKEYVDVRGDETDFYKDCVNNASSINIKDLNTGNSIGKMVRKGHKLTKIKHDVTGNTNLSLQEILSGNVVLDVRTSDGGENQTPDIAEYLLNMGYWDFMFESITEILDIPDSQTGEILAFAKSQMVDLFKVGSHGTDSAGNYYTTSYDVDNEEISGKYEDYCSKYSNPWKQSSRDVNNDINSFMGSYIGLSMIRNRENNSTSNFDSAVGINLTTMTKAFLTIFKQFEEGTGNPDNDFGIDTVKKSVSGSDLVDNTTVFTVLKDITYSNQDMLIVNFYDTLFNQLCLKGWTENANINDKTYLQNMLQGGTGFITKIKDDGYYYQGNYSTDTYIKEIVDETLIAQAEAKYNTEKNKLNQKEQTIDLKMKNLDTEISSLSTEYDTVKSLISKNVEKVFKRYSA